MRPVQRKSLSHRRPSSVLSRRQHGLTRVWLAAVFSCAVIVFVYQIAHRFTNASADNGATSANAIESGYAGACLDVYHNELTNGAVVDAADCNDTTAQAWKTTATTVHLLNTNLCMGATSGGLVELDSCSSDPGQVWLRNDGGYFNPNTGKCLEATGVGAQAELDSCSKMTLRGLSWTPGVAAKSPTCGGSEGNDIACNAAKQWTAWRASGSNHEALLTAYTDGTPYEEWCADFVSYVYQQAGHPFTNGSADGWDENNANGMADLAFANQSGFTMHQADSGYTPRAGDIAFFDYPGGHVEIVVSGGKKPSFVYGNYEVKDPSTGNGQMWSNTVLQNDDGVPGQIMYYLSPNS